MQFDDPLPFFRAHLHLLRDAAALPNERAARAGQRQE
jgi:hypothetical protein